MNEPKIRWELFNIFADFAHACKKIQGKGLDVRDKLIAEYIPKVIKLIPKEKKNGKST